VEQAVHTLARRYCQEQFSEWCRRYEELQRQQARPGGEYSPEAYDTFPRYLILQAILRSIEALAPESAGSVELLVEAMSAAAQSANSNLTAPPQNAIAEAAIEGERQKFIAHIRSLTAEQIRAVAPLRFRRTLTREESKRIWAELKTGWGVDDGYWYPFEKHRVAARRVGFPHQYGGPFSTPDLRGTWKWSDTNLRFGV